MIHEFKTDAHVVFQIDDADLTWLRWFDPSAMSTSRNAHGRLVKMPTIEIGKPVHLMVKMWSNEVAVSCTTKVIQYRTYQRENPVAVEA